MVALSFERVLALYFPLKMRNRLTVKSTRVVIFLILILNCILMSSIWIYHKVYKNQSYKNGWACLQSIDNKLLATYHTFVASYATSVYPNVSAIIISGFLIRKVITSRKERAMILSQSSESKAAGEHALSGKEVGSCFVVICLDIFHFMLIFPTYLAWSAYNLLDVDTTMSTLFLSLGKLLWSATIIARFWNLYIYCFFIKEFRNEFRSLVCCSLANQSRSGHVFSHPHTITKN